MKRLFSLLVLILFASISVLSGCDLISLNEAKYYSTVVVTVGDTEFTKEDLTSRFNTVGSDYIDQGYSIEEAMQYTIDSLVNRELLLQKAHQVLGDLSQYDKNAVWQEVYDYINGQLKELEGQIKAEWGIISPSSEEEEDNTVSYDPYSPYEPAVIMEAGQIVKVAQEQDPIVPPIGDFVRENYNTGLEVSVYENIQEEAWKR